MEGEARAKRKHFLLFATGLLALLIVLLMIGIAIYNSRISVGFRTSLAQLDLALEDGRVDPAGELIRNAIDLVRNSREALRLAARLYKYEELGGNPELGEVSASALLSRFPGNQDLRALLVDFLLRRGKVSEAASAAMDLEARDWLPLKIEALLKAGIPLDKDLQNLTLPGVALPIPPERYSDPGAFLEAWTLTRDYRYLIDAALLMAALGEIGRAADLLASHQHLLRDRESLRLLTYLEQDAYGAERALRRYSQLVAVDPGDISDRRLLADLYLAMGMGEAAASALKTTLESPDVSEEDFRNLVSLQRSLGQNEAARESVSKGLERFPRSPWLLLSHAALNPGEQKRLVQRYLSENPGIPELRIANAVLSQDLSSYERLLPFLWTLYREDHRNLTSRKILAWLLWSLDDREGLRNLAGEMDLRKDPWFRQYRVLSMLREGRDAAALAEASMIPQGPSYYAYQTAGLRTALSQLGDPAAIEIYARVPADETADFLLQPGTREYILYLSAWRMALQGSRDAANAYFLDLERSFPRSAYIPRIRYWIHEMIIKDES